MPADTTGPLNHFAMEKGTDCNVVNEVYRGNGVYASSYCNTDTSQCYRQRE